MQRGTEIKGASYVLSLALPTGNYSDMLVRHVQR